MVAGPHWNDDRSIDLVIGRLSRWKNNRADLPSEIVLFRSFSERQTMVVTFVAVFVFIFVIGFSENFVPAAALVREKWRRRAANAERSASLM